MGQYLNIGGRELSIKSLSFLAIDLIRDVEKMVKEDDKLPKMVTNKEQIYILTRYGMSTLCMYADIIGDNWIEDKVQNDEYWSWKDFMTMSKGEYDKRAICKMKDDIRIIYSFFTKVLYEMILNNRKSVKAYLE